MGNLVLVRTRKAACRKESMGFDGQQAMNQNHALVAKKTGRIQNIAGHSPGHPPLGDTASRMGLKYMIYKGASVLLSFCDFKHKNINAGTPKYGKPKLLSQLSLL